MSYLFFIIIYAFTSAALWKLAQKNQVPRPWLSCVPIGREYLATKIAGKSLKWFILTLIPIINIWAAFVIWTSIAKKSGYPSLLGIAMLIPFLNLLVLALLAYNFDFLKRKKAEKAEEKLS